MADDVPPVDRITGDEAGRQGADAANGAFSP